MKNCTILKGKTYLNVKSQATALKPEYKLPGGNYGII